MYGFHQDKERYFDMQYRITRDHIIPFIREHAPAHQLKRVLEIGCAEAGVLKAFLEEGAFCTGIELSASRIKNAMLFHEEAIGEGRIEFVNRNIFDIDPENDLGGRYDLVVLKDVIEHIPGQKEFIHALPQFLNPGGLIFFAFPPWQMPYGGHQQVCKSKWLSKLPYFHLLPAPLYKGILKLAGEDKGTIDELMDTKATGISIERFEEALRHNRLRVLGKTHFMLNPIYQFKFGIKPRPQNDLIQRIPYVRNFLTTAAYYLVTPE